MLNHGFVNKKLNTFALIKAMLSDHKKRMNEDSKMTYLLVSVAPSVLVSLIALSVFSFLALRIAVDNSIGNKFDEN